MAEATGRVTRGTEDRSVRRSIAAAVHVVPGERLAPPLRAVLVCEILLAYVRVRWHLPGADIREVVSSIRARPPARRIMFDPLETRLVAARLGNAVGRTLALLPTDSRCLVQSLVLSSLLSARAISSTFVIGARSRPEFEAHAWVEHMGRPMLPPSGFHESRLLEI